MVPKPRDTGRETGPRRRAAIDGEFRQIIRGRRARRRSTIASGSARGAHRVARRKKEVPGNRQRLGNGTLRWQRSSVGLVAGLFVGADVDSVFRIWPGLPGRTFGGVHDGVFRISGTATWCGAPSRKVGLTPGPVRSLRRLPLSPSVKRQPSQSAPAARSNGRPPFSAFST